jgi:hypothetical protein
MSETNSVGLTDTLEMLAQWEGPVIHEPGLLFEENAGDHPSLEGSAAELAAWIAVTALSNLVDSSAANAIRAKVVGVLSAWRRRFGQAKIEEVKQQLLQQLQSSRNNRKITDEELRQRIERLFDEIEA